MTDSGELSRAVREAAGRAEVVRAVGEVYEELGRRIEERRPVCRASGRCCRFEEFGHRLYVTTIELAAFVNQLEGVQVGGEGKARGLPVLREVAGGCVYQVGGLCSVHGIRPFGCRVFFCDETAEEWQREQYELVHGRIKKMHEEMGVPYFYVEWRRALSELGLSTGQTRL
jgi:Fe-S-cluster containining protein